MDASSLFYKQLGRLKNGITEFFHNIAIDCSCLNKKVCKKKNWGSPCLFLKYAKQKGILKASCYVSVAIATSLVVLKITEFKSRNINFL